MNEIPNEYIVKFRDGKSITVHGVSEILVVSGAYILKTVNNYDFTAPLDVIDYISIGIPQEFITEEYKYEVAE